MRKISKEYSEKRLVNSYNLLHTKETLGITLIPQSYLGFQIKRN